MLDSLCPSLSTEDPELHLPRPGQCRRFATLDPGCSGLVALDRWRLGPAKFDRGGISLFEIP